MDGLLSCLLTHPVKDFHIISRIKAKKPKSHKTQHIDRHFHAFHANAVIPQQNFVARSNCNRMLSFICTPVKQSEALEIHRTAVRGYGTSGTCSAP